MKFIYAEEVMTYDNLLLDGSISNADVRGDDSHFVAGRQSALHVITWRGSANKHFDVDVDVDVDFLLSYILTCDPPADVNGRSNYGYTPTWWATLYSNTSAVKVLIDFGGDRTIKTSRDAREPYPNATPLDIAKKWKKQETIKLLTECFPSEE